MNREKKKRTTGLVLVEYSVPSIKKKWPRVLYTRRSPVYRKPITADEEKTEQKNAPLISFQGTIKLHKAFL